MAHLCPPAPRTVYAVSSTEDGVVRYIGSTVRHPSFRLRDLLFEARMASSGIGSAPVAIWARDVIASGHFLVITTLVEGASRRRERLEIQRRVRRGEALLNVAHNPTRGLRRKHQERGA